MSAQFSAFGITTTAHTSNNTSEQNTNNNNNTNNNITTYIQNMNPFRSNTHVSATTSITNNNVQLPISISLNNNNNNNTVHQNSQNSFVESMGPFFHNTNTNNNNTSSSTTTTTNNNTILKNLRHYIYGADPNRKNNNNNNTLTLDLPDNVHLPAPLPPEELNKRKNKYGLFSIRLTPYIDNTHNSNNLNDHNLSINNGSGLFFEPIIRTAGPGSQLVIGRYTERVREAISKLPEQYHPVVFKSKVISRAHGCFKVDSQGNWFIKDVKSSSGTFLNHQRLAPASTLSKDFPLHDGDILQLGMDFRGGIEDIYKCVKMKVELNRSWKRKANKFNRDALQRIKNLQKLVHDGMEEDDEDDCSICLSKIKPCQAIFISPCSHSWHFHCVRRLVMLSYPEFVCPNCRSTCDLEASESDSDSDDDDMYDVYAENEQQQNKCENNNMPQNVPVDHNSSSIATAAANNVASQPSSNNEDISSMDDDINIS